MTTIPLPPSILAALVGLLAMAGLVAVLLGRSRHVAALAVARAELARLPAIERELQAERARTGEAERALADTAARHDSALVDARRLELALYQRTTLAESLRSENGKLSESLATVRETLEQERAAATGKIALLQAARETMGRDFRVLADEILSQHGRTFGAQNHAQIDAVLAPLRERIGEFATGLAGAREDSVRERAVLAEQIRALATTSARMSDETIQLTRALKGQSHTQGAWGEMVLSSILEKSGLRESAEFTAQASHRDEDGRRKRPDVIVHLPGGQHLVVDAKVSLRDYEVFSSATDETVRRKALGRHLAAMRAHVRELSARDYTASLPGDLDHVVMFVPVEGALAAALAAEPELTRFAIEHDVALATPTTLMIALRTVASVWRIERRNRNAEEIADRAGRIYGKFVGLLEDLQKLGTRIDQTGATWRDAMGKLTNGSGNLVRQIETLKSLGATTTRSIPVALLSEEDQGAALDPLGPGAPDPVH